MLLANVGCRGTESSLTECCSTRNVSNLYCHDGAYAGVRCKPLSLTFSVVILFIVALQNKNLHASGGQCIENSIHLVGELSQNQGVVMICLGGSLGRVCDDQWYFGNSNEEEAIVVCRQLGFSTDGELNSCIITQRALATIKLILF